MSRSYQILAEGKAQAFATDDILLYGLIARHKAPDRFKVVGDYLSYDPYGIMFARASHRFPAVVERTFRKLATNGDLMPLQQVVHVDACRPGERLRVPISLQLEEAFKVLDSSAGTRN